MSMKTGAMPPPRLRGAALAWTLAASLVVVLGLRLWAIGHESVNWDEFALLKGARHMSETGQLYGGGRPGLAAIVLLPFVADCEDEILAIQHARLLWLGFTGLFLAGLAAVLFELQPDASRRRGDALLGVLLLACVPAFLEWSIQVRSDQIALAGGTLGGAVLLASRRRPTLALAAGLLFGVGYLSSQKLFYVATLMGVLALGQLFLRRELRPGREAVRAGLCALGFGVAFAAFRFAVSAAFQVPEIHTSQQVMPQAYVSRGLSVFEFYRNTIGYSQYLDMLPTLAPQMVMLAGLAVATGYSVQRRPEWRVPVVLAWAVLALGAAVAAFHAAAFFYFWMTLGLFPAVAFAAARGPIRGVLEPLGRGAPAVVAAWWLLLGVPGLLQMALMRGDTQAVQRESLGFAHRNFGSGEAGFQPESALFCHAAGQPIATHFSETIYRRFAGADRERNSEQMLGAFRAEPISFLVESFRLNQFPVELRRFWAENYQPYRASVFVAGRRLAGARGTRSVFELIVPGHYRWIPARGPHSVRIDGQLLGPGDVLAFDSGDHTADFVEDVPEGVLVLALNDPPGLAPLQFYKSY